MKTSVACHRTGAKFMWILTLTAVPLLYIFTILPLLYMTTTAQLDAPKEGERGSFDQLVGEVVHVNDIDTQPLVVQVDKGLQVRSNEDQHGNDDVKREGIFPLYDTLNLPMAPWNPLEAGFGHAAFHKVCSRTILDTGCQDSLPLDKCIRANLVGKTNETECAKVMNPCSAGQSTEECRHSTAFRRRTDSSDISNFENLLSLLEVASVMKNETNEGDGPLEYWMTAGSIIGSLTHHSIIPWDDDVDIYVRTEHMDDLFNNLKSLGLFISWNSAEGFEKRAYKIYNATIQALKDSNTAIPLSTFFQWTAPSVPALRPIA